MTAAQRSSSVEKRGRIVSLRVATEFMIALLGRNWRTGTARDDASSRSPRGATPRLLLSNSRVAVYARISVQLKGFSHAGFLYRGGHRRYNPRSFVGV